MKRWYVVQTQVRSEQKALWHLQNQGFEAYLPQQTKRWRHARKTQNVKRPLFAGYMFARLDLHQQRWRAIQSSVGVKGLVCYGGAPAPVPEGIVESIRSHEDETGIVRLKSALSFNKGDRVKIDDGPFCGHEGLWECANDTQRISILLDLLGRQVMVRIDADVVSACA
jgi:transcriptional antiterminator RfaH